MQLEDWKLEKEFEKSKVVTCYLGIQKLFETSVFKEDQILIRFRVATKKEAENCHKLACELLKRSQILEPDADWVRI